MKSAEAGVRLALDRGVKLSSVRENTAMVSCVDGQLVSSPTEIADCLIRQISMPVRWSLALANLRHVFDTKEFIYLGPHKALAHLASNEASQLGLPDEVMSIASKEGLNEVQARYASQGQLS